jgi:hypothetical protein
MNNINLINFLEWANRKLRNPEEHNNIAVKPFLYLKKLGLSGQFVG